MNKFISDENKVEPTIIFRIKVVEGEFILVKWHVYENRDVTIN